MYPINIAKCTPTPKTPKTAPKTGFGKTSTVPPVRYKRERADYNVQVQCL
jgi:hypothetical protein